VKNLYRHTKWDSTELEAKNALLKQESSAKIKSLEERLLRLEKLIEGK